MSATIGAIYSVNLTELRGLVGSKDKAKKKELTSMIATDFFGTEEIDDMLADDFETKPNTLVAGVAALIDGSKLRKDRGYLYGYAIESLCWAIGTTLFLPTGFPGHEVLDEYLTKHQSPVRLSKLLFSGFPIPIPEPFGFPVAGFWTPEEVVAMSDFLATKKRIPAKLKEGFAEVQVWLAEARLHETDALVGFCY